MNSFDPKADPEAWNLIKAIYDNRHKYTEQQRAEVERAVGDPTSVEFELMGRKNDEIGFRIEGTVYWVPVIWLVRPVEPGSEQQN